mmetsp:Transcript_36975/g.110426  ORF Transcript_36975/g.110426 Transcript_36975/m.110426 type:complete len:270 (+) Transcript_36975:455-1264(+)
MQWYVRKRRQMRSRGPSRSPRQRSQKAGACCPTGPCTRTRPPAASSGTASCPAGLRGRTQRHQRCTFRTSVSTCSTCGRAWRPRARPLAATVAPPLQPHLRASNRKHAELGLRAPRLMRAAFAPPTQATLTSRRLPRSRRPRRAPHSRTRRALRCRSRPTASRPRRARWGSSPPLRAMLSGSSQHARNSHHGPGRPQPVLHSRRHRLPARRPRCCCRRLSAPWMPLPPSWEQPRHWQQWPLPWPALAEALPSPPTPLPAAPALRRAEER